MRGLRLAAAGARAFSQRRPPPPHTHTLLLPQMSLHIVVLAYVMVVLNAVRLDEQWGGARHALALSWRPRSPPPNTPRPTAPPPPPPLRHPPQLVMTPFILYALGFASRGMDWVHGAVFAALLAPTDAVAVTAILKMGGGPEGMVTLLEGEALLNDASGITLYTVWVCVCVCGGGGMKHAGASACPPALNVRVRCPLSPPITPTHPPIGAQVFMGIMESYPPDAYPTVTSLIPGMLRDVVK